MLLGANDLHGYSIHATDGDIGHVDQFYFDDEAWAVRYLVIDTGNWLTGKRVLISPIAVNGIDRDKKTFDAGLTKEQVKNSPDVDTHMPISRRREMEYFNYYGWPYYWYGGGLWGGAFYPGALNMASALDAESGARPKPPVEPGDSHLRSTKVVLNYHVEAADGEIGHVEDFIMDDRTWTIRYLVVNTRDWWPGERVLVPPRWIDQLSWAESRVYVGVDRASIKSAPRYEPSSLITREYERKLYGHYGRPGYGYVKSIGSGGRALRLCEPTKRHVRQNQSGGSRHAGTD
jgi:hypothetical protein